MHNEQSLYECERGSVLGAREACVILYCVGSVIFTLVLIVRRQVVTYSTSTRSYTTASLWRSAGQVLSNPACKTLKELGATSGAGRSSSSCLCTGLVERLKVATRGVLALQ